MSLADVPLETEPENDLFCKYYFLAKYVLGLTQSGPKRGSGPQKPPRPESWSLGPTLSPVFSFFVTDQISLHSGPVLVYSIIRVPFAPESNNFPVWENGHEFMDSIPGPVELHGH